METWEELRADAAKQRELDQLQREAMERLEDVDALCVAIQRCWTQDKSKELSTRIYVRNHRFCRNNGSELYQVALAFPSDKTNRIHWLSNMARVVTEDGISAGALSVPELQRIEKLAKEKLENVHQQRATDNTSGA